MTMRVTSAESDFACTNALRGLEAIMAVAEAPIAAPEACFRKRRLEEFIFELRTAIQNL
jgi:hypothetical protein